MNANNQKKFLRFRYAAIKRYGDKFWTIVSSFIEFNPNYIVNCACLEEGPNTSKDYPFMVELSNGTKFICFMHNYGQTQEESVLSEQGEAANSYVDNGSYGRIRQILGNL